MTTLRIRVRQSDWKAMRQVFPGERGETVANYLKRYVAELKRMGLKGFKYQEVKK